MLFVSITRARLVCVLSYAGSRFIAGANTPRTVSRFTSAVGKPFSRREDGLTTEQATQVVTQADRMQPPQDQATAA